MGLGDESVEMRQIEPRDLMGDKFKALPPDKQIALLASALAGVMDHTRRMIREVDGFNERTHAPNGELLVPIRHRRYY